MSRLKLPLLKIGFRLFIKNLILAIIIVYVLAFGVLDIHMYRVKAPAHHQNHIYKKELDSHIRDVNSQCTPPIKNCYECAKTNGKQSCTCTNHMYLLSGECRSQTTTSTQVYETPAFDLQLPALIPETKATLSHAWQNTAGNNTLKSVLLFTTLPSGGSTVVTDYTSTARVNYCAKWGCHVHIHQAASKKVWANVPHEVGAEQFSAYFERYRAFAQLLKDDHFERIETFVFMDAEGAILRQDLDLSPYLPNSFSEYDVHFGDQPYSTRRGRPNLGFIAAKRSATTKDLFDQLADPWCTPECITLAQQTSETFDECCINHIIPNYHNLAVISMETPLRWVLNFT
jgi:hypothetical protein